MSSNKSNKDIENVDNIIGNWLAIADHACLKKN